MRIWDKTTDDIYNPDKINLSSSSIFVSYEINSKNFPHTGTVELEVKYSKCTYIYVSMGGSSFNYLTDFLVEGNNDYLSHLKNDLFELGKIKISSVKSDDNLNISSISEVSALNVSRYSVPKEVEYFISNEKDMEALMFLEGQIKDKTVDSIVSIKRTIKSRPALSYD